VTKLKAFGVGFPPSIDTFPVMAPPSVTSISSYDHAGTDPNMITILATAMNSRIDSSEEIA
jgi:hypothetical protein